MNLLVLVVAGVFVAAGLVLIVLSFLVGRSRSPKEILDVAEDAESPAADAEASAFIDEPLATDLAEQLKGRKKAAPAEGSAQEAGTAEVEAPAPSREEAAETPKEEPTSAPVPVTSPTQTEPPPATPAANQVGFNFRVQLGFKFLQNGLYQDGVAEFQKALSLTEDREAKLKLYVEIGNAFRSQRLFGPAGAAYLQATSYTDNEMLSQHLERTIAEMMDTDKVGAADSASGSEKEE